MNDDLTVLVFAIAIFLSAIGGWIFAHSTIASECEKLGGFYVGSKTFSCQEILK